MEENMHTYFLKKKNQFWSHPLKTKFWFFLISPIKVTHSQCLQDTVENSERDGNTRPPDLPLEKPVCRSGSNMNWTWNNRLVPNWERSTSRLYIVTLLI